MNIKKNPGKDQEKNKSIFFKVGLIISLAVLFFAFEWKHSNPDTQIQLGGKVTVIDTENKPIKIEDVKPKPKMNFNQSIKIVSDDKKNIIEIPIDSIFKTPTYLPPIVEIKKDVDSLPAEPTVFQPYDVENQPEFTGGETELFKYLAANLKYPRAAVEANIQGTVYITFIVEENGSISNVIPARTIGGGCDEEAVRVIKNMPRWKPGKQYGRPVRVRFNIPVKFSLE